MSENQHSYKRTLYLCFDNEETKSLYNINKLDHNNWEMGDSGFDLYFPKDLLCTPHKMTKVSLGVKCAVYNNKELLELEIADTKLVKSQPYSVYPRSSIGKTPLRMANSTGIIDPQYRGDLIVLVDNISSEPYIIERGQRLFQVCSQDLTPFYEIKIVDKLQDTQRGAKGIGSSGK